MVALNGSFPAAGIDVLQSNFLQILPRIETHARIYFRNIACPGKREDKIVETVALAWQWFLRLSEKGKDANQFPMAFAFVVALAVKCGRRLVGQEKANDVMTSATQLRRRFMVGSLPEEPIAKTDTTRHRCSELTMPGILKDRLRGNLATPVFDQVVFRLDWPVFFGMLSPKHRSMVEMLSTGHRAHQVASAFELAISSDSAQEKLASRMAAISG
jgi:hypothetical protein